MGKLGRELLRSVLDDEDAHRAREVLMAGLEAVTWAKTGEEITKEGRTKGIYGEVPDHRTRVWAGLKIYELVQGKATERVVISTPQGEREALGPADLVAMLARDPELAREILEQTVASAKSVELVDDEQVPQLEGPK